MTSKGFLTVAGLVMMLQGILFLIFSQDLTKLMFPYASEEGVRIGMLLREIMAGGAFSLAFFCLARVPTPQVQQNECHGQLALVLL